MSPKAELKFTLCNKKSSVISDFTYTLLPVSGSAACQERPKCNALLMKKRWRNRGLGLLTSGVTSSPELLMFWDTFEEHLKNWSFWRPSFLLALFHQWENFSPNCRSWYFLQNMEQLPSTVVLHLPSITSCIFFSYFNFSPFLTFLSSSISYSGLPSGSISLN